MYPGLTADVQKLYFARIVVSEADRSTCNYLVIYTCLLTDRSSEIGVRVPDQTSPFRRGLL